MRAGSPPRGNAAGLQTVVAEIEDAADAHPGGHVGRRPTGQDRHRHAVGPRRRDARQPAQRAASERDDRRRAGVARALGQGAVEIAHDEQPPRARSELPDRPDRGAPLKASAAPFSPGRPRSSCDVDSGQDRLAGRRARRSARRSARRDRDVGRRTRRFDRERLGRRGERRRSRGEREESPEQQPCDGDSDDQAGDDRQACFHVARRVPVRAVDGASRGPLLPCRSHAPPRGSDPHANRSSTSDRSRRHLPGSRRAVAHDHRRRRSGHDAGRHGQPRRGCLGDPQPA